MDDNLNIEIDVNDVVMDLASQVATLTVENSKLRAAIARLTAPPAPQRGDTA